MKKSKVLGANEEYVQQTMKYGRTDALLAFSIFVVMLFLFGLMGKVFGYLVNDFRITETFSFYVTGIISLFLIALVFLLCFIRKQKFTTIGFGKTHAIKSLSMGIMIFIIVIALKGIIPVVSGSGIQTDIGLIAMKTIYFLVFVAFMEEIIIRGYIGTRLYGYFRNKGLSIIIVGLMFSIEHIPFQLMFTQMNLLEYIIMNRHYLIVLTIFHFLLQWLYSKYNSIIAPTIFHFIWDFIKWFVIS